MNRPSVGVDDTIVRRHKVLVITLGTHCRWTMSTDNECWIRISSSSTHPLARFRSQTFHAVSHSFFYGFHVVYKLKITLRLRCSIFHCSAAGVFLGFRLPLDHHHWKKNMASEPRWIVTSRWKREERETARIHFVLHTKMNTTHSCCCGPYHLF